MKIFNKEDENFQKKMKIFNKEDENFQQRR
jgi:hypothetical protein